MNLNPKQRYEAQWTHREAQDTCGGGGGSGGCRTRWRATQRDGEAQETRSDGRGDHRGAKRLRGRRRRPVQEEEGERLQVAGAGGQDGCQGTSHHHIAALGQQVPHPSLPLALGRHRLRGELEMVRKEKEWEREGGGREEGRERERERERARGRRD